MLHKNNKYAAPSIHSKPVFFFFCVPYRSHPMIACQLIKALKKSIWLLVSSLLPSFQKP
jgi:hypothetical protein